VGGENTPTKWGERSEHPHRGKTVLSSIKSEYEELTDKVYISFAYVVTGM
jgi:hypothetical protein